MHTDNVKISEIRYHKVDKYFLLSEVYFDQFMVDLLERYYYILSGPGLEQDMAIFDSSGVNRNKAIQQMLLSGVNHINDPLTRIDDKLLNYCIQRNANIKNNLKNSEHKSRYPINILRTAREEFMQAREEIQSEIKVRIPSKAHIYIWYKMAIGIQAMRDRCARTISFPRPMN